MPSPTPDAQTLRAWSKVDFDSLTFSDDVDLQRLIDRAAAVVGYYTGRYVPDPDITYPPVGGAVPLEPGQEPLWELVVQKLTEIMAYRVQPEIAETLSDFDTIQSFSAGNYSESRRDPRSSAQIGIAALVILQEDLWPLMTEDAQDNWIRLTGGVNAPAQSVTGVDYTWGREGMLPTDTERLWPRHGEGEWTP